MQSRSYKCILVDDDPEALDILEELLGATPEFQVVAKERGVDSALQAIHHHAPDLVFLDIEMPGKDGFELVRQLQALHLAPGIIFVTAFNQYAIQAFKVAAFDYLLKPLDQDDLAAALLRFKATRDEQDIQRKINMLLESVPGYKKIIFQTRTGLTLVNPHEILYCEADGNYVDVHLTSQEKILVSRHLGDVVQQLPAGQFFRINRSMVVNLTYLTRVDRRTQKCFLKFNDRVYEFLIPLKHIRRLEEGV